MLKGYTMLSMFIQTPTAPTFTRLSLALKEEVNI